MLAELMLPDQTHVRSQDWTIFFLHKDAGMEDENEFAEPKEEQDGLPGDAGQTENPEDEDEDDEEQDVGDDPPLMYVLNLVNTKQDLSAKRYVAF